MAIEAAASKHIDLDLNLYSLRIRSAHHVVLNQSDSRVETLAS